MVKAHQYGSDSGSCKNVRIGGIESNKYFKELKKRAVFARYTVPKSHAHNPSVA